MIAIESTRPLQFPVSFKGTVNITMDLIQQIPSENRFLFRLVCTCYNFVEQDVVVKMDVTTNQQSGKKEEKEVREKRKVKVFEGTPITKFHSISYKDLNLLFSSLGVTIGNDVTSDMIDAYRKGLLLITQNDCNSGNGDFGSLAEDWKIVQ